jgi:hypothetical protein
VSLSFFPFFLLAPIGSTTTPRDSHFLATIAARFVSRPPLPYSLTKKIALLPLFS